MASKNSKGLGRGIDALFTNYEAMEEDSKKNEQVEEIKLDAIRPNPYQPRKHFEERALKELADSIKQNGVFQPIILRKSSVKGYEIIAGERRVRASRLAGKETIPAIIREFDEQAMIEIAILENLQREDLSPMEEAEAYQMLMDELNFTQLQVSERLGKSRSYVANYLRLLSLPEDVKALVREGKLTMGQARTLLGLKNMRQVSELAARVVTEGITVRQLEGIVQELTKQPEPKHHSKIKKANKPSYIIDSEVRLMSKFGTAVQIVPKGQRGKIEIEYLSDEDLNRILEIINIESEN